MRFQTLRVRAAGKAGEADEEVLRGRMMPLVEREGDATAAAVAAASRGGREPEPQS